MQEWKSESRRPLENLTNLSITFKGRFSQAAGLQFLSASSFPALEDIRLHYVKIMENSTPQKSKAATSRNLVQEPLSDLDDLYDSLKGTTLPKVTSFYFKHDYHFPGPPMDVLGALISLSFPILSHIVFEAPYAIPPWYLMGSEVHGDKQRLPRLKTLMFLSCQTVSPSYVQSLASAFSKNESPAELPTMTFMACPNFGALHAKILTKTLWKWWSVRRSGGKIIIAQKSAARSRC